MSRTPCQQSVNRITQQPEFRKATVSDYHFSPNLETATGTNALVVDSILGVDLCGLSGDRRDKMAVTKHAVAPLPFVCGFAYAVISGVMGSMLNLGLAFGGTIQERAQEHGARLAMVSNAVWLPCLYAGFIPGIIYCMRMMKKNHNVSNYAALPAGITGRWQS
jgi:hypothetical protein